MLLFKRMAGRGSFILKINNTFRQKAPVAGLPGGARVHNTPLPIHWLHVATRSMQYEGWETRTESVISHGRSHTEGHRLVFTDSI